MKLNRRKEDD